MSSTTSSTTTDWTQFDEDARIEDKRRRGRAVYADLEAWLADRRLDPLLHARLAPRALKGDEPSVAESPAEFALCLAEALGAPEAALRHLGRCATLFWAAADTADDVDDEDVSGGLHPGAELGPPTANDACALLFLAQQAALEWRPEAAADGARFGLRMAGGQARDLATTNRLREPDVAAIVRDKAGAELALFFKWASLAAGREPEPFEALGEVYGAALQVFSDIADVYLKPVSDDFVAGKWTLPLALYRQDDTRASHVWEALDRTRGDVQARVRWEAARASLQALGGLKTRFIEQWEAARRQCPHPERFDPAAAWLVAVLETVAESVADLDEAPKPAMRSIFQAVESARAWLEDTEFAEEHRWGLFGRPYVAGSLFTTIFQAAALRAAGGRWESAWERLLRLRDPDGWRYYPGHSEIPPDADDAGLILGYFGDTLPRRLLEATAQQLIANFAADSIHTWMGPMPGNVAWEGDDCPATLANACWGLLRIGQERAIPPGMWRRLTSAAETSEYRSPFYTPEPTRFFMHRALAAAVLKGVLRADETTAARRRLESELEATARRGGSFAGDELVNACSVLAADVWGLPIRPETPLWFVDRQHIDGAWAETPCFRTPGVLFRPFVWGHRGLTTCFVLLALAALQRD